MAAGLVHDAVEEFALVLQHLVDPLFNSGERQHPRDCHRPGCADAVGSVDGLILEVHPDPEQALSDGYQSLNLIQFNDVMARCRAVAAAIGKKM